MRIRNIGIGLIAAALLALSGGCLRNQIVIRVKPDGSGDILVTRVLSGEAVQLIEKQMAQMRAHMGAEMPEDPFFNEEALKQEATLFGPDVVFVNARKVDRAGTRGTLTHYRFDDIREVVIRSESFGMEAVQQTMMSMHGGGMGLGSRTVPPAQPDKSFRFDFEAGDTAQLTIRTPAYPKPPSADSPQAAAAMAQMQQGMAHGLQQMGGAENPFGLTGQETPAEAIGKMYKDSEISVEIDILGEVVKTDARFPAAEHATRFSLLRVLPEQLAQGGNLSGVMAGATGGDSMVFFSAMIGLPDTRIETNRTVSIEFK